ncbi:TIGR02647 family protein [Arsukibacterium sp.]|uniref:TIGR02647 family protein n=1 Tax=Arsukibacterium sp. TaxID=1977258 RepID=UPI002FDA1CB2
MPISSDLNEEIRILTLFNLDSAMAGIKAHKAADPVTLAAIERLYQKGLLTQPDGGYLTDMGINCAEHLQTALAILNPPPAAA